LLKPRQSFRITLHQHSFDRPIDGPMGVIDVAVTMSRDRFILFCFQALS